MRSKQVYFVTSLFTYQKRKWETIHCIRFTTVRLSFRLEEVQEEVQ